MYLDFKTVGTWALRPGAGFAKVIGSRSYPARGSGSTFPRRLSPGLDFVEEGVVGDFSTRAIERGRDYGATAQDVCRNIGHFRNDSVTHASGRNSNAADDYTTGVAQGTTSATRWVYRAKIPFDLVEFLYFIKVMSLTETIIKKIVKQTIREHFVEERNQKKIDEKEKRELLKQKKRRIIL